MKRGITPGVQVATFLAVCLILFGLLFGLKPVTRHGGVYAPGEHACGSAWNPLYTDLATSFDQSCWKAGIRANLTASLVLVGLGLTIGIAGFSAAGRTRPIAAAVAASAHERRPCRHCAEDIRPAAKVCPYCWRDARAVRPGRMLPNQVRPMTPAHEREYVITLQDRKSTRLNSSHSRASRMPSSA